VVWIIERREKKYGQGTIMFIAAFLAGTGVWALRRMEFPGAAYLRILLGLPARLALMAWARRAEITCDRAGLVCCQDIDTARKALLILACGSRKLVERIDLEEFKQQNADLSESYARWGELFKTHPNLPKRVRALELFSESRFYRCDLLGEAGFPARSRLDLDTAVYKLLGDAEPAAQKLKELQEGAAALGKAVAEMSAPMVKKGKAGMGFGLDILAAGLQAASESLAQKPKAPPKRRKAKKA